MTIPKPSGGEDQKKFISRCMGNEHMVRTYDQEQRSAVCFSTWREGKKSEAIKSLDKLHADIKKQIKVEEKQIMIKNFQHEIDGVIEKSWDQEAQQKFAFIYASCRSDGNSKEASHEIAKSAITRETRDYAVEVLRKAQEILNAIYVQTVGKAAKGKGSKYINPDGTFKGGFDGCVKHHTEIKGLKKENAEKLCAYIGRKAGKIPG